MKNNLRVTLFFAALAVVVAGVGLESPAPIDQSAQSHASIWANAFPVAQAGFANPAPGAK